jgi:hypothetical protein
MTGDKVIAGVGPTGKGNSKSVTFGSVALRRRLQTTFDIAAIDKNFEASIHLAHQGTGMQMLPMALLGH